MLGEALPCNRLLDYSLLSSDRFLYYSLLVSNRLPITIVDALSVIVSRLFMVGLFIVVLIGIMVSILILAPLRIWINIGLIGISLKVIIFVWCLII